MATAFRFIVGLFLKESADFLYGEMIGSFQCADRRTKHRRYVFVLHLIKILHVEHQSLLGG